jgi:hypothetical protein
MLAVAGGSVLFHQWILFTDYSLATLDKQHLNPQCYEQHTMA